MEIMTSRQELGPIEGDEIFPDEIILVEAASVYSGGRSVRH